MFEYQAYCKRVVDGDTFVLHVDLGFGIYKVDMFRLADVDTPELRSKNEKERLHAQDAKKYVEMLLHEDCVHDGGKEIWMTPRKLKIRTKKDKQGKYGRYLASVYIYGIGDLGNLLKTHGYEKKEDYDG